MSHDMYLIVIGWLCLVRLKTAIIKSVLKDSSGKYLEIM